MPRVARIVIPDLPYHITQRGNNRQDVFFVDDDRRTYLHFLKEQADRWGLTVWAYCLMANHVHLVAVPRSPESLAKAVGRTHYLYTRYVNRLHRRTGHLWQNRFYSCGLDEDHFGRAIRYVERNPVRAKLVRQAWNYPWSSAAAHTGQADASGLLHQPDWIDWLHKTNWKRCLTDPEDQLATSALRTATHRGRPLGSDGFLSKLEKTLGRRVRALPAGRPKKTPQPKPAKQKKRRGKQTKHR